MRRPRGRGQAQRRCPRPGWAAARLACPRKAPPHRRRWPAIYLEKTSVASDVQANEGAQVPMHGIGQKGGRLSYDLGGDGATTANAWYRFAAVRAAPARLVRCPWPQGPAVATRPDRLPRLGLRGHAPADPSRRRGALFQSIHAALSDAASARASAARRGAASMDRARLLRASAQSAGLRKDLDGSLRRRVSRSIG